MERSIVCDQAGTEALAAGIAGMLRAGDAILLEGSLGAGKSTFARALIRSACKLPALDVPSPSYTLLQSYDALGLRLHHFDLWRLDGPEAVAELGWDEALADIVIVEWPDRLGALRPANALLLGFASVAENVRRISLNGWEDRDLRLGSGGSTDASVGVAR